VSLSSIANRIETTSAVTRLRAWTAEAQRGDHTPVLQVKGAAGSLPAFLLYHLHREPAPPLCCLVPDEDAAAYLQSDLEQLLSDPEEALLRVPATQKKPYDSEQSRKLSGSTPLIERADALQRLAEGFDGILITSVPAVGELVPPPQAVQQETLTVETGEEMSLEALADRLLEQDFSPVEFVEEPGDFARRGGILDVFPYAGSYPVRIDFFGDEIDGLREFDPQTQRSVSRLTTARLVPNLEREEASRRLSGSIPIFEYLPADVVLATVDESQIREGVQVQYDEATDAYDDRRAALQDDETDASPDDLTPPGQRFLDRPALEQLLARHPRLLFGAFATSGRPAGGATQTLALGGDPQPSFNSNMDLVRDRLRENGTRDLDTFLLCDSQGQSSRLRGLLESEIDHGWARLLVESLHEGFEWPAARLAVYTDHQIFNRYHRPSTRKQDRSTNGLSLRDIKNLTPGDFVVHVDHGIGTFAGLKKITVRDKQQEAVRLNFADNDILYVNVNALYKLNKYTGKEGHQPTLTKLGSEQWERTKERTKSKVKDIARDLIRLYAKRKASDGYAFSSDTTWQHEMEASFAFEDTPDQAAAAEATKRDMEDPVPMDRLVCGDVGFGKTEVAVRAAFKAVQDGKQVAMLVPTTILAQQHHETFSQRLERFPVNVEVLSRFRTRADQRAVLERLNKGQVDILIGTHRITSDDITFDDLGLLIIDEEQRFGVKTKETLREMRANIDTLTLTATPIPRTLQFSLLGARDLSLIQTPPPNRQPINTEIHTFDQDLIRDAIRYEVSRGGQAFFIHNRVKTINEIAEMVRAMVPDVRVGVGHGQMGASQLEDVMVDFLTEKLDVLVSTSIIENGVDISNANTMIINHAGDHFGLSELHQLRGRVGRSQRKAFCYLLVPSIHSLTDDARERLKAVEQFSDLGSGFDIAMRDLDIRGAGALLGAKQSGFIEDVGYETYHKILDQAIKELREEEFDDVFDGEAVPPGPETSVDVEVNALIPDTYVRDNTERLNLYRRISDAPDETTLVDLLDEMDDRFGDAPEPVQHLLTGARLRLLGEQVRLPKVVFKNERLFLYLPSQDADPYFYEAVFHPVLEKLALLDREYVMKDDVQGGLMRAIVQDVPTLNDALAIMERLLLEETETVATVEA
jgi:transcription-repair coupling factor (superfamily II helicase)